VGTGPFILTDFVPGSSATLIRNSNYWDKNPVGPGKGNQLPYVDGINFLIVTDVSSRLAAIRTARADWTYLVEWEDAGNLMKTTPNLKYYRYLPASPWVICMRTDKPELPFKDKRVRQALMMAINFDALKNDLYGGQAETLVWPITPAKGFESIYVPLAKLPQSVQALYSYNPEKAKQLLIEAGYPNGLKTKVVCQNISTQVDPLSAIKSMWAKVGIDLEIQPKEYGVYTAIGTARSHEEMLFRSTLAPAAYANMASFRSTAVFNSSYIDDPPGKDPTIEAAYQEVQKNIIINQAKADQLFRDLMPYLLEQAYVIPRPTPYSYVFWWPWVKNYHGEVDVNYTGNSVTWIPWVWIDQDLKERMTGKR
jgi:peptide/nickel transport system substrate-binding protein